MARKRHTPWLSLAPLTLVLGALMLMVLGFAFSLSLGLAPMYGINRFPTLQYVEQVIQQPEFLTSIGLTAYYAIVSTAISLVLALLFLPALQSGTSKPTVLSLLYKYPLMVPYMVGIALVALMFSSSGILARLTFWAGLISRPAEFPAILFSHSGWGVILVYVWKQTPFLILNLHAVALRQDQSLDDSARILGATPWQRFLHVRLPLLLPAIASSVIICLAFNFGAFEAPLILGGGFPDTLPVWAWRLFSEPDYEFRLQGMVVMLITGFIMFSLLLISNRLLTPTWSKD